ncbi:hypothetical protein [Paraglaciecola sp. L3A3]|uniref:hypothetical protein n=1 Tax=Paraglaciecola sp. L3A3 TaxID=2686358 RepID=UPI00131DD39B|nr:hypothetical protein [Paraglaciecola sp. L3A3]
MCINWLKKVANKANHNAFTDLCEYQQLLFCCFREAKDHISRDGSIRIIALNFSGETLFDTKITLANTDLRDPKLSVTAQGQLLLTVYARLTNKNNQTVSTRNLCWLSQSGKSWTSSTEFADKGWWLWRLTWHKDIAYGLAYNRKANALHFYKGDPRRSFHLHQANVLSLTKHNKGYPNESAIIFQNNIAYALVRRDADTYSAQLGYSHYPYKQWKWIDLKAYIGGPVMLQIKDDLALVAGRIAQGRKLVTGILSLELTSGKLKLLTTLPSAGDNSYPGLVIKDELLYVSYYSSHESRETNVYLAEINLQTLLKAD